MTNNILRSQLLMATLLLTLTLPLTALADTGEPFLRNPISCPDFICLMMNIIKIFLGGIAVIATLMFVYGGYIFLMSAGNAEAVKKGKDTLFWATVGIVTVLGSWVAIQFILKGLISST